MNKLRNIKMDSIGKNSRIYQEIFVCSCSVFLIVMQLYIEFISKGIDPLGFEQIENTVLRILLSSLCRILFFGFVYTIIYKLVHKIKSILWVNQNKEIWVQGIWLHIHVKKNVRIGHLTIKQNFYSISAEGQNFGISKSSHIHNFTDWSYYVAKVLNEEDKRNFIGCYTAIKHDDTVNNDGIHMLKVEKKDKNGFPTYLRGHFKDTFDIKGKEDIDVSDHSGKLFFFRPSKKCLEYLFIDNGFSYDRLSNIVKVQDLSAEPFVTYLKEILKEKKLSISPK